MYRGSIYARESDGQARHNPAHVVTQQGTRTIQVQVGFELTMDNQLRRYSCERPSRRNDLKTKSSKLIIVLVKLFSRSCIKSVSRRDRITQNSVIKRHDTILVEMTLY